MVKLESECKFTVGLHEQKLFIANEFHCSKAVYQKLCFGKEMSLGSLQKQGYVLPQIVCQCQIRGQSTF